MRALFAKGAAQTSLLRVVDVRIKIAVIAAAAVCTVWASSLVAQVVLAAASLCYALLLRRAALLAVLYVLMAAMMGLSALCAWAMEPLLPGLGGVSSQALLIPFLRGLTMMHVVLALAMTTRIEELLSTLERMRVPFYIFLPTAVMLRFIPTFTQDIRQVWETLRIKGWPMGFWMLTTRPLLSARLVLAPILFRALKSSETLGVAAELKGMGSRERTLRADARAMSSVDARVLAMLILTVTATLASEVWLSHWWQFGSSVAMP